MTQPGEGVQRTPFSGDPNQAGGNKIIPLLSSSTASSESPQGDPMDVTPTVTATMGPPVHNSPDIDQGNATTNATSGSAEPVNMNNSSSGFGLGAAAAAATQQPKVVQTAFIHKLYNDVFHTGSPESTLWEFKHGNGNFKRGDLVGLREIKRRASRHALIHRDSFSSGHKANASSPGTPAEPMPDTTESRLASLEHNLYDLSSRLSRSEENYAILSSRYQSLAEGLVRCHHWNHDLSHFLTAMVPDPDNSIHRDIQTMQKEIVRQIEMLRSVEELPEQLLTGRPSCFSGLTLDSAPLSPRQIPLDDPRRQISHPRQANFFRPPVPPHLAMPPRRYGSVGTGNAGSSPGSLRPQVPAPTQPTQQHPLASVSSPPAHLPRRHTSADIRSTHGWQAPGSSPFGSGQSTQWPSSPNRTPNANDNHQQVRDVLAQYEIQGPRTSFGSRQTTPPLTSDTTQSNTSGESGWSFAGSKFPSKTTDTPGPPTRRSSMASNVHSLLNPAETAERDDEDGEALNDDRKRKRLQ
ncbi:hypothetical protein FGG08_003417 [Glutinoglossum americanum]|uniref:HSF-type DNA-binding domain-containing protein n=1 Tax=Glutinoglossum americanum TaxID=1670608 RepID=A0A9P8IDD5_9PEZI|nr:hypothetical protein FGG08_003417 [Glutinoglossum americanum]